MTGADRVAFIALLWFAFWIIGGGLIGHFFGIPGTGMVLGFIFALFALLAWPWVMPRRIEDWMHDSRA